jgi:hypothetical protein
MLLRSIVLILCAAAAAWTGDALPPVVQKMYGIFDRLRAPGSAAFCLSDTEINDYLTHSVVLTPRPGLQSMTMKVFPNNYVSTFTVVDFDAVEKWKPGTVPKVLRPVLNGRRSIWVDARFRAENGAATFTIEKAYFERIPLPALVVQKMAEVVAARQPEHYDLSKPVPIPFGLRRVWTEGNYLLGER